MTGERANGVGIALSGGGFRATLFHIGSLLRLNELGFLRQFTEVTSVSGGSITAGYLAYRWGDLQFNEQGIALNFTPLIVEPLRRFCGKTIDVGSIIGGILSPFRHPGELIEKAYDEGLFHGATLASLPSREKGPRFTIYATSLQTGRSVRFYRGYLADYKLGRVGAGDVPLAKAVAASSAFPPVLCPVRLERDPDAWERLEGSDLHDNRELRKTMLLGDGGIYDNLGLERIGERYQTVLVSDAGAPFKVIDESWKIRLSQIARARRALDIIGEQTRALRRRSLMRDFEAGKMRGAYWGIATKIAGYRLEKHGLAGPLCRDSAITSGLSTIRTRLNRFTSTEQTRLINWGYALTDAAMRRYVLAPATPAGRLPYHGFPLD